MVETIHMPNSEAAQHRVLKLHVLTEATIQHIQECLTAVGIACLTLKGPHLAYSVYPLPLERVWCDLDILVRPNEASKAVDVLVQNGWRRIPEVRQRRFSAKHSYNYKILSPFGVSVELHRDFTSHDRYPVPIEDFFRRAESFRFLETEARGLAPTDLLLHLCLHMTGSYFLVEPKHVRDIALLLAARSIDWRLFVNNAKFAGAKAGCWMALRAAIAQHGALVPEWVLADLEPTQRRQRWLERWLDPAVFPIYKGPTQSMWEYQWRLGLALMDHPRDWIPLLMKYGARRIMDLVGRIGFSKS